MPPKCHFGVVLTSLRRTRLQVTDYVSELH